MLPSVRFEVVTFDVCDNQSWSIVLEGEGRRWWWTNIYIVDKNSSIGLLVTSILIEFLSIRKMSGNIGDKYSK